MNPSASYSRRHETAQGTVLLQDSCPPSLIECLYADEGLHAFTHRPEHEHQLLLSLSKQPLSKITLAYTLTGEIIGEVSLLPADDWWQDLTNAYEIAIQVSSRWRRLGIAQQLLKLALEPTSIEELILIGMGLCWHWDQGLGLTLRTYRDMLARLFAAHGFAEQLTTEPNIRMEPANILLVRFGEQVDSRAIAHFYNNLVK